MEQWLLVKSNFQLIRLMSLWVEHLTTHNKFYLSPLVCIHPKPISFIIGNTDIDILSTYLPTSPPIAPVLNVGLVSADTDMTVACEISPNLFAINLILNFINSYHTTDQIILTGSCLLQISISYFWQNCLDFQSSDLPISLPIHSAVSAELMPTGWYSYKYSSGLLKADRPCRVVKKPSRWSCQQHFSSKCEYRP